MSANFVVALILANISSFALSVLILINSDKDEGASIGLSHVPLEASSKYCTSFVKFTVFPEITSGIFFTASLTPLIKVSSRLDTAI